jgi:lipoprotein-anchoring transpeptidase ErfK/SrfK
VGGHRISVSDIATERFWQIAVLTAAGAIGLASPAEASRYYWSDYEPGFFESRPAPTPQRPQRVRPRQAKKVVEAPKDSVKPQGPLIIAISIERQTLKVYDANGFFAETPISTGMKGHPTPMGVFSIIQKHKLHHSNIYSGAPMPFMQRITWSGIAMHAGALPGYPASHGCIRMPMAFAARMWNWTKMGARVVVTPGEITPARFSHPLLAEQKAAPQPQPSAAIEPNPNAPPAAKADKAVDAGATVKPAISEANLELRSSVGHDGIKPLRDQTRTADASGATNASVTMSDASPSATRDASRAPPRAETKSEAATAEAEPVAAKPDQIASSEVQPVETKPSEAAIAEIKPADAEAADGAGKTPDEPPAVSAQASSDAVKAEATESAKPDETKLEAKAEDVKTEMPKAEAPRIAEKASDQPDDSVTAATDANPAAPDVKKDQTRLPNIEKAVVVKPEPPKPAGRIAVLVSRKDGKLYVRENFKPLFDVPVTIAPSDRLLGTHVFTAEADKNDPNVLRWSVVSLPVAARNAQKNDDDERSSRRRKIAGVVPAEVKQPLPAPNSPAEALDRIAIPPEAMARIAEALSTGGSIVVSDQGINQGGETGEGTDFIVSLR